MNLTIGYQVTIIGAVIAAVGGIIVAMINGVFGIVSKKQKKGANDSKYTINQTASGATQIGVQYVGISPESAAKQTLDIFMENFPKLQALARDTAEQRATELCNELFEKLKEKEVIDFTPFTEPDVQYILYEAQKNYVRFGEKESMNILTELVANRIQNNQLGHFKRITDSAIVVAGELSSAQLDCLSVLFILTEVHIKSILTVEELKVLLNYVSKIFDLEHVDFRKELSYLNFKGCLQLRLPDIAKIQAETYHLDLKEVQGIIPHEMQQFTSDYGLSEVGLLLGLINAEQKSKYRFDPHIWIRD